jgi:hypothetical protein
MLPAQNIYFKNDTFFYINYFFFKFEKKLYSLFLFTRHILKYYGIFLKFIVGIFKCEKKLFLNTRNKKKCRRRSVERVFSRSHFSRSIAHSLSLALSHSLSLTLSCSRSHSLTLAHSRLLSCSLSRTCFLALTTCTTQTKAVALGMGLYVFRDWYKTVGTGVGEDMFNLYFGYLTRFVCYGYSGMGISWWQAV